MITTKHLLRIGGAIALTIAIQGCSSYMGQQSSMATTNDAQLNSKVEAALASDPTLAGTEINVETTNSQVRLTGVVDTRTERQAAAARAGQVAGVSSVVNDLRLNNGD